MEEVDNTREPARRDEGHDRWLAMQSAYAEYRLASEELECTRQSADDTNERLKLPVLEGQQWLAFERYFETRMEFLEARFDERNPPSAALPPQPLVRDAEPGGAGSWLELINYKPILQILAIVLLGTMVFALLREQRRIHDLEAARDELQATLGQTRDGLRLLGQKLDAWGAPQHSGLQQVEHTVPAPARRAPATAHRATGRKPGWRRLQGVHAQQKPIAAKRDPAPKPGSSAGAHPIFRVRLPVQRKRISACVQCASGSGRI